MNGCGDHSLFRLSNLFAFTLPHHSLLHHYPQAFPDALFQLIPEAGHLPQIEQPERLLTIVWEFADSITAPPPVAVSFEVR